MGKDKEKLLSEVKKRMQKDDDLPLKKGATNLVFGNGDPDSLILFIGEGPGFWEDKKGIPFVGNAGSFLNQLLYSIKLPREQVFITNIVHYRPPENRDPEPSEIEAFKPYLDEIIDIIDPKMIVTLGRFSMAKFLPGVKITSVHGKKYDVNWVGKSIRIIPMYHPAAGLRNPVIKEQLQEDFKKLPNFLSEINEKEPEIRTEQMKLV